MPIRINLLAEAQAAAELRRKDPVKRGIWAGSFLVCLMILWIVNLQLNIQFEKKNFKKIDADLNAKMTNFTAASVKWSKIGDVDEKLKQLAYLSTNRFLWAPVLNALQQCMVDQVQVTRLKGEQTIGHEDAHDVGSGTNVQHLKAGMVEKTTLLIEAKDFKPDDQDYDKFKKRLSTFDFFAAHLLRPGFTMPGSPGPRTQDPLDLNKQFVTFTLVAQFPEARHDE